MHKRSQFSDKAANPKPAHRPKTPLIIPDRAAERAATNYTANDAGCFISNYSIGSHGYAQVGWQNGSERRAVTAHRAAWVYYHGTQIPDGMTVDHLCKERKCVNPEHLRLLSNFENARRTSGRDWPVGECANGHSNEYLMADYSGKLHCSICSKAHQRRWQEKLKLSRLATKGARPTSKSKRATAKKKQSRRPHVQAFETIPEPAPLKLLPCVVCGAKWPFSRKLKRCPSCTSYQQEAAA